MVAIAVRQNQVTTIHALEAIMVATAMHHNQVIMGIALVETMEIITDQRHAPIMDMHITMLHTIIMQCAHIAHLLVHTIAQHLHHHSVPITDAQCLEEYLV
jgi:hypothetical protein